MTATATEQPTLTGDYDIDPAHSALLFAAKHAMVTTVRGGFKVYSGSVHLDAEHPENSSATVEIDAASVDTGNEQRDTHLRSADFFNTEVYPSLTFRSTSAKKTGDDTYELTGDLTIRDTTKPVTVEFTHTGSANDPWGGFRVGFEGKARVNRRDWGLEWNVALDKGGVLVSEKVTLEFDIAAVKKAD
jgi:polyisoprenoid-binding protein YceI